MEKIRGSWRTFHERTKETPPSVSLIEAVKIVTEKNSALDIGAGALRDSKYMLEQRFQKVVAVDIEPATKEAAREINDDRLQVVISPFQEFNFPEHTFDLVNAQFSLPFIPPESFSEVFSKMEKSLKENGIFVGQLFGTNDSWNNNSKMTFHNLDQVQELFSGMKIIELREEERDGTPVVGDSKHWHIFYITARK
jgi:tellurite methyltransferase